MAQKRKDRKDPCCYPIKRLTLCNTLGEMVEDFADNEKEKSKNKGHVSKPKAVKKILALYFGLA